MSEPLRIAIIGAGLIGLSCADALRRAASDMALEITVFEQRSGPVRGASFCNSGMIHPSQCQSWANDGKTPDALTRAASQSVFALAQQSRAILLDNFKRFNLTDIMNRTTGCLQIYADITTQWRRSAIPLCSFLMICRAMHGSMGRRLQQT